MSMSISNIVNVQLNSVPKGAARKDFGAIAVFTPESGEAFKDKSTRYVYVDSQSDVEALFGVDSETAKCTQPIYAQSPRARQVIICRWQKDGATIEASKNQLKGGPLNSSLEAFKKISNGTFSLYIGKAIKQVTGLDFSQVSGFNAIAEVITEAIGSDITCTYDQIGNRFLLSANVAGENKETELFHAFQDDSQGDYVGGMLKLEDGQAVKIKGQDQIVLESETLAEALFNVYQVNKGFYGVLFAAQLSDSDLEVAAKWGQTERKLIGSTIFQKEQLENVDSNPYKKIKDMQVDHFLAVYDPNDLYAVSSAMSVLLSMNFSANNGTLTLKFKSQPTITADDITATEYNKAKALGINVYTYFDDVAMLTEGMVIGGKFADEVVILDWFVDAVQKNLFNALYKTPNKIPLTDKGQAILLAVAAEACEEGVNNGAFAPGKWTGNEFGKLKRGDFLDKGYYIWAAPMDTLSDNDREQRRATPIQIAVKLAGAIHFVDAIINYNR